MSHFVGIVFLDPESNLNNVLEPYWEGLEVPPYVSETREEVLSRIKKHLSEFNNTENEDFRILSIKLMQGTASDEELLEWYKRQGVNLDEEGNELTTYNPDSKWDWYSVGGRWSGDVITTVGDYNSNDAPKDAIKSIDITPYCFVDLNGEWHEKGTMGWWGMSSNEMPQDLWDKEFREYYESVPDETRIVVVDFHI